MEGLTEFARLLLVPATFLADQIGLPNSLPAVELSTGLIFLTACFGIALACFYHWLRTKHAILLVSSIVAVAAGIIGLLATVTEPHVWLYTLILAIIGADVYWRLSTNPDLPRAIRKAGIVWATAALILCAGTPVLYLTHTWLSQQKAQNTLNRTLEAERIRLLESEQARISAAVTKLTELAELKASVFQVGDPLLIALVQRMAIDEQLPYLLVIDDSTKVIARSQPVAAFGDTWSVQFSGINTGTTDGVALSERNIPLVLSARPIQTSDITKSFILVGGIFIDQTYINSRSTDLSSPLFFTTTGGISALAAPEGKALNALSSESIDKKLAEKSGLSHSFTLASSGSRYIVKTIPLIGGSGKPIGSLGSATLDESSSFRLRLDFILVLLLAVLVLATPALVWRKKEIKK